MFTRAAWIDDWELDADCIAHISLAIAKYRGDLKSNNSTAWSGIALDATEAFQQLHYSFDPICWDARDLPQTVERFVRNLMRLLEQEPDWINVRYSTGIESLEEFLRRRKFENQ